MSPAVNASVLVLDLEAGNVFDVALTEDVAILTLANPPAAGRASSSTLILRQDATGGQDRGLPELGTLGGRHAAARSHLSLRPRML
jgi:hypothetical protein